MTILLTFSIVQASENIETDGHIVLAVLPISAYGFSFYQNDNTGRQQFHYSFASMLLSTAALKLSINKPRPDKSNNRSFPSGHSAIAFHSADYLRKRYGWRPALPAFMAASFVGYSRVAADKHYVEDVFAGALLGIAAAEWFTTACKACRFTAFVTVDSVVFSLQKLY